MFDMLLAEIENAVERCIQSASGELTTEPPRADADSNAFPGSPTLAPADSNDAPGFTTAHPWPVPPESTPPVIDESPRKRSRRKKKRAHRDANVDDDDGDGDGWAPAAPWMRVARELGVQLGGRVTTDRQLAQGCPCCFGNLTGRGFGECVTLGAMQM